ncbi:Flagellar biosynthesis protein FliP [hydrothermal vent metagenome]|uniref:Flagellar biosynthetic protein FliP n=1 Tax=hydrothermal vent metagenome TaxID=652676 RepID=A0A3B0ZUS5_9ZZZZ
MTRKKVLSYLVSFLLLVLMVAPVAAQTGFDAVTVKPGQNGEQTYSVSIQLLALMTALTLLPAALMMMTSFTRIVIVLAILRQAVGLVQAPSSQTLIGLALFLTFFVMSPVFNKINNVALKPYLDDKLSFNKALVNASVPLRNFMLNQTRESDLKMFSEISGNDDVKNIDDIPFTVVVPAFITSELKTAFQIGFLLFIPFLIIDLVTASVLMSMGMMMLSPMIISLPFKIMLFVLVDGWNLVIGTLASSFYV